MLNSLSAWLKQPYNDQGGAFQWFLFVGLIIISLYLWHMIVRDLEMVEHVAT